MPGLAQDNTPPSRNTPSNTSEIDSAPSPQIQTDTNDGVVSGTLLDDGEDVVQGARVDLIDPPTHATKSVQSGSDGQFAFHNVAAGPYILSVHATGMAPYTSPQFTVQTGQVMIVPPIHMTISAGVTSVTVSGDPVTLSKEQVQIAVQQRIGGVIPNFYSSYDWNAPPMLTKQKYVLSIRSILDP
ncbi:MAG: carboxypeptidase regulatory-like domain-containing protein, partial [Acidobacteriota bacterium]|nr:carboxypeptidase regulatory-like domain-containing protein [Acidobacteriota bacterium]